MSQQISVNHAAGPLSVALASERRLVLSQKKDWGEILTGFEAANRYEILTESGQPLGRVSEVSNGIWATLGRWMFKGRRPFTLVIESGGQETLRLRRPWFWFFSTLLVEDGGGRAIGRIEQRFAFFQRNFDIVDAGGAQVARIVGPMFRPWTFEVRAGDQEVARIEKRWSGLLKEMFTDADNFSLTLPQSGDPQLSSLILAAALLIDFCYFENTDANRSS